MIPTPPVNVVMSHEPYHTRGCVKRTPFAKPPHIHHCCYEKDGLRATLNEGKINPTLLNLGLIHVLTVW